LLIIKNLIEKNRPYYSILKLSKLHPFIVKKSYIQAKNFTFQELKKTYQKFLQADLAIKTGKIDPGTVLNVLVFET
jgi:DNA polymerase III delta subunit